MTAVPPFAPDELLVAWHDVECGDYRADLPLWHELARDAAAGVLDVGAGTGRVALALARDGHAVAALDIEPALLAELRRRARAAGVAVDTALADAAALGPGDPVSLILVPMQTIQLLAAREGFFAGARARLVEGGRVAMAIATALEPFSPEDEDDLPAADVGERDGWRFVSQPVAIAADGAHVRLRRRRHLVAPDGSETAAETDVVRLARIDAATLLAEGAAAGLEPLDVLDVPPTDEHVGSEVVVLGG